MNTKRVYRLPFYLLIIALFLSSCRMGNRGNGGPENPPPAETQPTVAAPSSTVGGDAAFSFQTGRNDKTINIDGDQREFIVYVPSGYNPNTPTPLLFMFHGSNQSGNIMFENTDWVNKAEKETIIVIFPTGWEYPLVSEPGLHEKWDSENLKKEIVPGAEIKDDVKFTRTLLDLAKSNFNIDNKRIFASGFSNGGGFVLTRLITEMHDDFTAFAVSGTGLFGSGEGNGTILQEGFIPVNTSLYAIIGTQDEKVSLGTGRERPFPIQPDDIFNDPVFHQMMVNTTALLGLSMDYSVETDSPSTIFTFRNSTSGAKNEFIFRMVKGLFHEYPAGDNNAPGVNASDLFWDFFLSHVEQ